MEYDSRLWLWQRVCKISRRLWACGSPGCVTVRVASLWMADVQPFTQRVRSTDESMRASSSAARRPMRHLTIRGTACRASNLSLPFLRRFGGASSGLNARTILAVNTGTSIKLKRFGAMGFSSALFAALLAVTGCGGRDDAQMLASAQASLA